MLGVNPSSKLLSTDGISEYLQLIGLDWRMHFTYYFLTRQLSTYSVTPHKQELFFFPTNLRCLAIVMGLSLSLSLSTSTLIS